MPAPDPPLGSHPQLPVGFRPFKVICHGVINPSTPVPLYDEDEKVIGSFDGYFRTFKALARRPLDAVRLVRTLDQRISGSDLQASVAVRISSIYECVSESIHEWFGEADEPWEKSAVGWVLPEHGYAFYSESGFDSESNEADEELTDDGEAEPASDPLECWAVSVRAALACGITLTRELGVVATSSSESEFIACAEERRFIEHELEEPCQTVTADSAVFKRMHAEKERDWADCRVVCKSGFDIYEPETKEAQA